MALRDQPYFPLYVQDFLSDEKLNECSAESTGVYIRLLCTMHKAEQYGVILLRQKDKLSENVVKNFAEKLVKHMPYTVEIIERSLIELLEEKVITVDVDTLYQKRMRRDGELSLKRVKAAKSGVKKRSAKESVAASTKGVSSLQKDSAEIFADDFAIAKQQTNTENEIVVVIDNENDNKKIDNTIYKDCCSFLEEEFGMQITGTLFDKMCDVVDEFGSDLVKHAVSESVAEGVRTWKYAEGIFNNWRAANVKTVAVAKRMSEERRRAKKDKREAIHGESGGNNKSGGNHENASDWGMEYSVHV